MSYGADTILVAEELTPSDTASLNRSRVLGCAPPWAERRRTWRSSRARDLPLVVGADPRVLDLPTAPAILDGTQGTFASIPRRLNTGFVGGRRNSRANGRPSTQAHEPATTVDGHRVAIEANIGGLADAQQALTLGADGVELFRSEFLFLHRATAPTDEEQRAPTPMWPALGGDRRLVIRTLDVGGDKPLSYLPLPRETTPFSANAVSA